MQVGPSGILIFPNIRGSGPVPGTPVLHIVKNFTWEDVALGPLVIGTSPADMMVEMVMLTVFDVFDNGLGLTIGTDASQAEFMAIADNDPSNTEKYLVITDRLYTSDTILKMFFNYTTLPTTGSARVVIMLT